MQSLLMGSYFIIVLTALLGAVIHNIFTTGADVANIFYVAMLSAVISIVIHVTINEIREEVENENK